MNVFHKTIANRQDNQSWLIDALQFMDQMQKQGTSVESRKFISELSKIIRSSSKEDLSVSTVEQDDFSNMSPGKPPSYAPHEIVSGQTEQSLAYIAFSQRPEDLSRQLFHAILSFLKTRDEAPVLALSSLKNRVSAQCLIGGIEIPLLAYAPADTPGAKLEGSSYLHPDTFSLDEDLIKILDPRIYELNEATAQKYKKNFIAKGLISESASHADVERINKRLFDEKILNGSNGFLTGLVFRTPSLQGHDVAVFYSLYLLTFFILDDTTESMDSPQAAENFSKRALDILSGKLNVNDMHEQEGLQHPGYYLAGQLRQMFTSIIDTDPDKLDEKLANWYGLMADQFDSAVEEVKSKGQLDKILPSYGTHEDEREATIGTRPCLDMIDILLDVKWSRHMRRKLDLIEKKVAKAVFEFNNVISLHKELREAFVDTKVLSKVDFCAQFNAQTLVHTLSQEILLKLPLNGVLIRSYHSKLSLVTAMSEGISVYDRTIQELEDALCNLCKESSSPKELEALQARFSLAVGSTRWSMKTGRYTLDRKAVSNEWWKALNKDLFSDTGIKDN